MFKRGIGKRNLVGLDIGSSSVKAVELQRKSGNLQLISLGYENLRTDTIVDGQAGEEGHQGDVIRRHHLDGGGVRASRPIQELGMHHL